MLWLPIISGSVIAGGLTSAIKGPKEGAKVAALSAIVGIATQKLALWGEKALLDYMTKRFLSARLGMMAKDAATVGRFAGAAGVGAAIGIGTVTAGTKLLEETGILSEGATQNYIDAHSDLESAWTEIYSPSAIYSNIQTIWESF